jgi:hypothetical protein
MDFMDANRMTRATGPPYSPDLPPSDFFFFGDVKRQLSGRSVDGADSLLSGAQQILDNFEKNHLNQGFDEWVRRLE